MSPRTKPASGVRRNLESAGAPGSRKPLLKELAYAELKRLIQSGEIGEGSFLSERKLASRLGMSKTPIRGALEHLESQGLVAVSPQQGIVVRGLSLRELIELFELRAATEPYVVRRIAGRLQRDHLDRLKKNLSAQLESARGGDAERAAQLDMEFHLLLCEVLGNLEILALVRRTLEKLHRDILRITRQGVGRLLSSYEEHSGIANALRDGDGNRAVARMEQHLQYARQFLLTE